MSENNGVLKLTVPEGQVKIQLGSGPVVEIDVISAYQRWVEICLEKTEGNEDTTLRPEKLVQELGLGTEHNRAEALLFTKTLSDLVGPLRKKVEPDAGSGEPSSAASTDSTVSDSNPGKN